MTRAGGRGPDASGTRASRAFYTRWARLYDRLARDLPGVDRIRWAAVDRLAPNRGDVVVEMGCGTGANVPYLRERVGPEGVVLGVDFSAGVLARAVRSEGGRVAFIRGDATRPPLASREVDAVFASFVSGMLEDPAAAVRQWADLAGSGGRLAVLDLARSTRPVARGLNPLFRGVVRAGSPPGTAARHDDPTAALDRRVAAAHRTLREVCPDARTETWLGGFLRASAGTVG